MGHSPVQVKGILKYRASSAGVAGGIPATVAAPAGSGSFAALRHRNFRIFYIGHLLSLSGTWLQITAQGWLVLELTDSEFWLGAVSASSSIPILLFSLYAGAVADRRDKRSILIGAQSLAFAQALTLAVLTHLQLVSVGWILFLAIVLGIANSFEIPTRQSFFVELVGERDLTSAIALNSSAFNASRMVGPAIAGALIGAIGIAACFYLNALSYFAVIAGLLAIRREPPAIPASSASTGARIREGFIWIWNNPRARAVVIFISTGSVLIFPFTMLLPVFARDLLQVGAEGLGWLFSATGAGALAGGLSVTGLTNRIPRERLLLGAGAAMAFFVGAFALSPWFLLSLCLLLCTGFFMILSTATANSLLQSLVPNEIRGRVMAVYIVMFLGVTPVGYLLSGTLASVVGARLALAGGATVLLAILFMAVQRFPELREAVLRGG